MEVSKILAHPGQAIILTNVEVQLIYVVLPTRPYHGEPQTLRESGLKVDARPVARKVCDNEPAPADLRYDFIVNLSIVL
ncbi:MAG: hypothetical protein WBJ75_12515 [Pseudohongiellaceae bacterium]